MKTHNKVNDLDLEIAYKDLAEGGLTEFTTASAATLAELFLCLDPTWKGNPFERGFQELTPVSRTAARSRSMSSFTGAGPQPMHTDAAYLSSPPRYLVFECLHPGEVSCRTGVWVTHKGKLLKERPDRLSTQQWVFQGGKQSKFYSPVLDVVQGVPRIRFDPCCMLAASGNKTKLSDIANLLASYTRHVSFEWQAGTFLIIDNWRCMHARGAGGETAPSRRLRRWYLG